MKHHIIVKFTDDVTDKADLIGKIGALYSGWTAYPFLQNCELIPNCVDRPNRYDLMIVLTLDKAELPRWDDCALHKAWKKDFGGLIAAKAIFDCE